MEIGKISPPIGQYGNAENQQNQDIDQFGVVGYAAIVINGDSTMMGVTKHSSTLP